MAIIANLPYNFTNGTTADASQVMQNFNQIVNNVNTNAAQLTLTPQLASENVFTQPQQMSDPTKPAHAVTLGYATNNIGFLGTANTWTKNNVFSGGIDNTPIGQSTPAAGKFTTLQIGNNQFLSGTVSNGSATRLLGIDSSNAVHIGSLDYSSPLEFRIGSSVPGTFLANGNFQVGSGADTGNKFQVFGSSYLNGRTLVNGATDNGTDALQVTGSIAVSNGIKLNNGTTALNAYEEGTFTPTIVGLTTAGTPTYTIQSGTFTRVGRKVHVQIQVAISAVGGIAGQVVIAGLPYTSNSTQYRISAFAVGNVYNTSLPAGASQFTAFLNYGDNRIQLVGVGSNTSAVLNGTNLAANSSFLLSGEYTI